MKRQRRDARETRLRLLAAASEVFAAKGFWEATHAEICKKAKANTASVNYHFGSKESLYAEAWKHAFQRSMAVYPPDGGVAPDAPVEERLRGRILGLMRRIADPEDREFEIMHKEMANPTGLLTEAIQQVIEPMQRDTRSLVRELLGEGATDQQVCLCEMSVMGQCFGPMLRLRHSRMVPRMPSPGPLPFDLGVEELADHVLGFSLAGIRGIRDAARMQQQQKKQQKKKKEKKQKKKATRGRGKRPGLRGRGNP